MLVEINFFRYGLGSAFYLFMIAVDILSGKLSLRRVVVLVLIVAVTTFLLFEMPCVM